MMHVISCRELFISMVIVLTCVQPGSSIELLLNLQNAVLAAESIFGSLIQTIKTYAKEYKNLYDIFDVAVEEHCIFKCPVESVKPKPKYNHVPTADGCGSLGLKIKSDYLPVAAMKKCCDAHDICYDTCNKNKELCDTDFKRCLYSFCDKYESTVGASIVKTCKIGAKMLFTGTLTLGCKSYLNAQKNACYCPQYGWKDPKNYKASKGDADL